MADPLLVTEGLTKSFQSVTAVDRVDFELEEDTITALIGPNGAGKTTFFNLVTGVLAPDDGEVRYRGEPITGMEPHEVANLGIVRSYQVTNFFPELTVRENIRLAAQTRFTGFSGRDFLRHHATLGEPLGIAEDVLDRLGLADVADQEAHSLSHGQQRHLEVGIAFANDADLLLLDEPTAGMSPDETADTVDLIREMAADVTIMLVEHDMDVVMGVSDLVAVMHRGEIITVEPPEEVRENRRVQDVYLAGGA